MTQVPPASAVTHARRLFGLASGLFFIVIGIWLFVGDALVLAKRRPQYGDGPFGVLIGPILVPIGIYLFWSGLASYGLIKPPSRKAR